MNEITLWILVQTISCMAVGYSVVYWGRLYMNAREQNGRYTGRVGVALSSLRANCIGFLSTGLLLGAGIEAAQGRYDRGVLVDVVRNPETGMVVSAERLVGWEAVFVNQFNPSTLVWLLMAAGILIAVNALWDVVDNEYFIPRFGRGGR